MNIVAIVQARMGSSRFPGKVMARIGDTTLIELLLERLETSKTISEIIVASTTSDSDDILCEKVRKRNVKIFRGSERNVLERFYRAALLYKADVVVRITGDCPLVDPDVVDRVVEVFINSNADYVSNIFPPTFPDGFDVEVFSIEALTQSFSEAVTDFHREHVTPYMREGQFRTKNVTNEIDHSELRLTVDEKIDLTVINEICNAFFPSRYFNLQDIIHLLENRPDIVKLNSKMGRNDGAKICTGQKLWKRAKQVIPGGNMLYQNAQKCSSRDYGRLIFGDFRV